MEAEFVEAGKVLIGGVKYPLVRRKEFGEGAQPIFDSHGVDEKGSRALSADLDEVGPCRVADSHGALCVDGERACSGGEGCDGVVDIVIGQFGNAFARDVERSDVYRV